jgi:hypothetical protein
MLSLEPLAVRAALVRTSRRHLDAADQREARRYSFGQPVFSEQVQVADPRDAAQFLYVVHGRAADVAVLALAQVVAPDVR